MNSLKFSAADRSFLADQIIGMSHNLKEQMKICMKAENLEKVYQDRITKLDATEQLEYDTASKCKKIAQANSNAMAGTLGLLQFSYIFRCGGKYEDLATRLYTSSTDQQSYITNMRSAHSLMIMCIENMKKEEPLN